MRGIIFEDEITFVLILRKVRSFVGSSSLNMVLAWSTRLLRSPLYWTVVALSRVDLIGTFFKFCYLFVCVQKICLTPSLFFKVLLFVCFYSKDSPRCFFLFLLFAFYSKDLSHFSLLFVCFYSTDLSHPLVVDHNCSDHPLVADQPLQSLLNLRCHFSEISNFVFFFKRNHTSL